MGLSCREFVEFLGDYLSGDLPAAQVAVFNAHLALCPSCVSYTKTYQEAVRLGRGALLAEDDPLPPEVPEELVRAVLASRK